MKFVLVFCLLCLCCRSSMALAPGRNAPADLTTTPPAPNLIQVFQELQRLVAVRPIKDLIARYLLNDEQFQSVIRAINTYDAYVMRASFLQQPEVISLRSWVRAQMMYLEDSLEMDKSVELTLFNPSPYWSRSVYGWEGFLREFLIYLPSELIRNQININIAQNPTFAQFWTRVQAVKVAYERVVLYPETQRIVADLQTLGVNVTQVDQLIRNLFDWQNVNATAPKLALNDYFAYRPQAIY